MFWPVIYDHFYDFNKRFWLGIIRAYLSCLGFEYLGLVWYLGKAGESCDSTCKHLGLNNLAEVADGAFEEDECSLINHFRDQGETKLSTKGSTSYFTFGYFYTNHYNYYCATNGSISIGVKPGKIMVANGGKDRRLICPCYQI